MAKDIRSLTGIRGAAATWVVLYHVHERDALHGVVKPLLLHGYLAVDLFFLLSGFVMALSYGRLATAGWTVGSYKIFLMHRFGRIYPLYVLMLCAITVLIMAGWSKALPMEGFGAVFLANLALVQAWFSVPNINAPAWSISTEFAAYLLFPLLAAVTLTTRRPLVLLAVPLACGLALLVLQFAPITLGDPDHTGPFDLYEGWPALLRCVSEFTIGLAACRLTQSGRIGRWTGEPLVAYAVTASLLALLCLPETDVLVVTAMAALILVLAAGHDGVSRLMSSRAVFFLGEISYSMYLLHSQFLRVRRIGEVPWLVSHLGATGADLVALTALYASLILCSWLTYRMVEQPCRAWFRRVGSGQPLGKKILPV